MRKVKVRLLQLITIIRYVFFKLISFTYKNKYSDVWLISERGDEARDNAYVFYKYLKREHPEIKVKYLISKKSIDIEKISRDDVVYLRSNLHFKLYISSKYLISTHLFGFAPEFRSFNKLFKYSNFFKGNGKKVFLQHGIIKDFLDEATSKNTDLDLFICGAKPEYDYIVKTYGYKDSVVKYTGLARYDLLSHNKGKYILLMPTWRKKLFYINNNSKFKITDYYKRFNSLINNKSLLKLLSDNNVRIVFYPHYEIQRYISSFTGNDYFEIANKQNYDIQELIRNCSMMITDYSSVYFDVAYQEKPLIYYQFDYDDFRATHYKNGYFDYNADGFGDVVKSENELIDSLRKIIENNYKVEEKYKKRINSFFIYRDNKNCERIYNEIIKLYK